MPTNRLLSVRGTAMHARLARQRGQRHMIDRQQCFRLDTLSFPDSAAITSASNHGTQPKLGRLRQHRGQVSNDALCDNSRLFLARSAAASRLIKSPALMPYLHRHEFGCGIGKQARVRQMRYEAMRRSLSASEAHFPGKTRCNPLNVTGSSS